MTPMGFIAVLLLILFLSIVYDHFSGSGGGSALSDTRRSARNEFDRQADSYLRDVSRYLGRRR